MELGDLRLQLLENCLTINIVAILAIMELGDLLPKVASYAVKEAKSQSSL